MGDKKVEVGRRTSRDLDNLFTFIRNELKQKSFVELKNISDPTRFRKALNDAARHRAAHWRFSCFEDSVFVRRCKNNTAPSAMAAD